MKEYEFNPNNIEHCLERADALKAKRENQPVELCDVNIGTWEPRTLIEEPFVSYVRYRRKPTPVARFWSKPSDVPGPVCWMRLDGEGFMIIGLEADGVEGLISNSEVSILRWSEMRGWNHSTDMKTWLPCTTTEP